MALRLWVLGLFCLCSAGAASAQVYKCQSAGKTVYSDTPCAQGAQSEIAITPGPDPHTQDTARDRLSDEVKRADQVVAEARKRSDADAKRRAEIAVAEHKAEEARLKKEAAEAQAAANANKAYKPKLSKPKKPGS
jgi:hypothetical protein